VKSKDPSTLGFELDEFLNLTGVVRLPLVGGPEPLAPEKFVIYTYMPQYENPYGRSDLRAAYKHWWSKDAILRFYNTYLEKYGSPTAKGTYRKGTTKQQQDDLLLVLDKIQQETAIVLPEDVTVELLEAQRGGEAGYLGALEYHDRQIAKAILGQTLTVDEGVRVGSYAQARVHLEVMRFQLEKLRRDLEESVVGEQIIRRLIDYNFPHGRRPRFSLGALEDRDIGALGDLVSKLIEGEVIAPKETWIREYLGLPGA
jgi:phage gp29-like protein